MIEGLTPLLLASAALGVLMLATPLTLLASMLIRWLYLRGVARAMAVSAGVASGRQPVPPPARAEPSLAAPATPRVTFPPPARAEPSLAKVARVEAGPATAARNLRRALARIAVAGLCFVAVMAAAVWLALPLYRIGGRILIVAWTYGWPVLLALLLVGPAGRGWRAAALAAYVAPWCLGTVWMLVAPQPPSDFLNDPASAVRGTVTPPAVLVGWLTVNGAPTLLWGLVLNRWLRAIGPLILAFVTLLSVALVAGWLLLATPSGTEQVEALRRWLGWTPMAMLLAFSAVVLVAACALGWTMLSALRWGYLQRRLNERTILVDTVWLMFAAWYTLLLTTVGVVWALAGPLAFAAAKAGGEVALRWPPTRPQPPALGHGLCFLRVFALGQRSERLFDALARRWRHLGWLSLIAGPDLAIGTLQPHQLLDFVSGHLAEHFIADEAGLAERLVARDRRPDRDGLFRVESLFCHADTWQPVLRNLVAGGDRVVMDLRSFDARHAGCRFELEQLVYSVPLERWTVVVDASTDMAFLRACVNDAWRTMPHGAPNVDQPVEAVRVHPLDASSDGIDRLFAYLCRVDLVAA